MRYGKGSHVVVCKDGVKPFVVPLHNELKKGTIDFVIKSSQDFKEGFYELL